MPYIKKEDRKIWEDMALALPKTAGELNYVLTKIALVYLPDVPRYNDYNEVIGVLECMKQEFYRRAVAPYEDKKIKENGDVYEGN